MLKRELSGAELVRDKQDPNSERKLRKAEQKVTSSQAALERLKTAWHQKEAKFQARVLAAADCLRRLVFERERDVSIWP